jgi:uroporphyrinogen-III synthase
MSSSLAGKRVVITRAEVQADEFINMLRRAGAIPILFPTIEIQPIQDNLALDSALLQLPDYDWIIFTSTNGVRIALDRMVALGLSPAALNGFHIAVIGPATEMSLRKYKIKVDVQPQEYVAEALYNTLITKGLVAGQRCLLLRANIARAVLREQLTAYGAKVDEIAVYHTLLGKPTSEAYAQLRAGVDIITFSSSSTVRNFFEMLGDEAQSILDGAQVVCIGPVTAETFQKLSVGQRGPAIAAEYTIPGLMAILERSVQS